MSATASPNQVQATNNHVSETMVASDVWERWLGHLLLFGICFATTFNITLKGSQDEFNFDIAVLIRLAICGACGLYGFWYLPQSTNALLRFPAILLVLFALWTIPTAFKAESRLYSLAAGITVWCEVLFVPAAMIRLGKYPFLKTVLYSMLAYVTGSWILYFLMPEIGVYQEPGEFTPTRVGSDANQLALQCMLASGLVAFLTLRGQLTRTWGFGLLAYLAVTMHFTDSRTSMICYAAGAGLFLLRTLPVWARFVSVMFLASLMMLYLLINPPDLGEMAVSSARSGDVTEIYTLNGRDEIWRYSWEQFEKSKLFGHGFGASRYALSEYKHSGYDYDELHHAHNVVLNTLLCTGIPGGVLMAMILVIPLFQMFFKPSLLPDMLCLSLIISTLTETTLFGPMPRVAVIVWIMCQHWRFISGYIWQPDSKQSVSESASETLAPGVR